MVKVHLNDTFFKNEIMKDLCQPTCTSCFAHQEASAHTLGRDLFSIMEVCLSFKVDVQLCEHL